MFDVPSDEILAFSLCLILTSARLPRQQCVSHGHMYMRYKLTYCTQNMCHISLGDIQNAPMRWVLALFAGFPNFWSVAPKFRPFGGGMCILLKSVRKGHFRNVWVGGGVGGHIFEQTELQFGPCIGRSNARGTTDYFSVFPNPAACVP